MCKMTENMQADVALSRKAVFVRCCLKDVGHYPLPQAKAPTEPTGEDGFLYVADPTKWISVADPKKWLTRTENCVLI